MKQEQKLHQPQSTVEIVLSQAGTRDSHCMFQEAHRRHRLRPTPSALDGFCNARLRAHTGPTLVMVEAVSRRNGQLLGQWFKSRGSLARLGLLLSKAKVPVPFYSGRQCFQTGKAVETWLNSIKNLLLFEYPSELALLYQWLQDKQTVELSWGRVKLEAQCDLLQKWLNCQAAFGKATGHQRNQTQRRLAVLKDEGERLVCEQLCARQGEWEADTRQSLEQQLAQRQSAFLQEIQKLVSQLENK